MLRRRACNQSGLGPTVMPSITAAMYRGQPSTSSRVTSTPPTTPLFFVWTGAWESPGAPGMDGSFTGRRSTAPRSRATPL